MIGGTSGTDFAIANLTLSYIARVTPFSSTQPHVDFKVDKLGPFYPHIPTSNIRGFACHLRDNEHLETNPKTLLDAVIEHANINHVAW